MTRIALIFGPALGVAMLAGTAMLIGCSDPPPPVTRTTTEQTTTTAPAPVVSTTTTTTRQVQQP